MKVLFGIKEVTGSGGIGNAGESGSEAHLMVVY